MKFKIGDPVYHVGHDGGEVTYHGLGVVVEYNDVQGGHYGKENFPYVVRFLSGFAEVYRDEELCHEKDYDKKSQLCRKTCT